MDRGSVRAEPFIELPVWPDPTQLSGSDLLLMIHYGFPDMSGLINTQAVSPVARMCPAAATAADRIQCHTRVNESAAAR
jgi:hypothetical protein